MNRGAVWFIAPILSAVVTTAVLALGAPLAVVGATGAIALLLGGWLALHLGLAGLRLAPRSLEVRRLRRRVVAICDVREIHLVRHTSRPDLAAAVLRGMDGSLLVRIDGWGEFWTRPDVRELLRDAGIPIVAHAAPLSPQQLDALVPSTSRWVERHPVAVALLPQTLLWGFVVACFIGAAHDPDNKFVWDSSILLGASVPTGLIATMRGLHFATVVSAMLIYAPGEPLGRSAALMPQETKDLLHRALWRPAFVMAMFGAAMAAVAASTRLNALLAALALVPAAAAFLWPPDLDERECGGEQVEVARQSAFAGSGPASRVSRSTCRYRARRWLLLAACLSLQIPALFALGAAHPAG